MLGYQIMIRVSATLFLLSLLTGVVAQSESVKATSPVPGATEAPGLSEAPDVSKAPDIPCQPGDNTPTLPDGECVACLNDETLLLCRGSENEACFWRDCDDELVPILVCQPGSEIAIPGLPAECNLQCLNVETGELCSEGDFHCDYSGFDLSCVNYTVDPLATVDPCPIDVKCVPGDELAIPGFPTGCDLKCRNFETDEICSDGDSCCGYELFNISCVSLPPITTTIPEPVCKPGDKPPLPPSIACYKCLSPTGGACIAGQYCDWQQLDRSQCPVPTKPATEEPIPEEPGRCEPVTTPDDCPTCLCLNEDCDQCSSQRGEQCSWQDINDCKGIKNIEKPFVEMRRFSLIFKIADCRDILDHDGQRQEFLGSFIQQIMGLIGTEPTDINLSCGSLIADFTVYDDQLDLQAAEDKLNRGVKNGNFKVDVEGTEYTATEFKDITQDSDKKKSALSSFTSLSWSIIAAIACVLLFAIFLIVATMCYAGLRRHQEDNLLDDEQGGTYKQSTGQKRSNDYIHEPSFNIAGNEYFDDTHM